MILLTEQEEVAAWAKAVALHILEESANDVSYLGTDTRGIRRSEFVQKLEAMGFFTAPASSSLDKHGAFVGGLVTHSVLVAYYAACLSETLDYDVSSGTIPFLGLMHDIGKCGMYIPNVLKSGKVSDAKPFERVECLPMGDGLDSVRVLSQHVELPGPWFQAIAYHNMLYTPMGREIQMKEHPLTLLLHWADMWSARFVDNSQVPEWLGDGLERLVLDSERRQAIGTFFGMPKATEGDPA